MVNRLQPGDVQGSEFHCRWVKVTSRTKQAGLFYCRSVSFIGFISSWNGQGNISFLKLSWKCCIIQPYSQNIWCWHTKNILIKGATGVMKNWQLCKLNNSQNKSENHCVSISWNQKQQWILWTDKAIRSSAFTVCLWLGLHSGSGKCLCPGILHLLTWLWSVMKENFKLNQEYLTQAFHGWRGVASTLSSTCSLISAWGVQ